MFLFLLPYGTDRNTSRLPAITFFLMALNAVVYLLFAQLDSSMVLSGLGFVPANPSLRTILSSMFVHIDPIHLIWNLFFLWIFGPNVEDALGRVRFAFLYIACGFAAALIHMGAARMFMPNAVSLPILGASGAIAGVLGVFAIRFHKTNIKVFWSWLLIIYPIRWGTFTIPALLGLAIWFVQQFAGGIISIVHPLLSGTSNLIARLLVPDGVAYWSHIGGMAFGALVAWVLDMRKEGTREHLTKSAHASMDSGLISHAAENLRGLAQRDPDNADVHAALAKAYAMQRDVDHSISHYQRSIELSLRCNECDKAIEFYSEMKGFYKNSRLGLPWEHRLVKHLTDRRCFEAAIALIKDISATYPGTPEAEVALARAADISLNYQNRPSDTIAYCERFLSEYPISSLTARVQKMLADARKRVLPE